MTRGEEVEQRLQQIRGMCADQLATPEFVIATRENPLIGAPRFVVWTPKMFDVSRAKDMLRHALSELEKLG